MNRGFFPIEFLHAQTEKHRKGRIFRAACRVRALQIHSPDAPPTDSLVVVK